MNVLVVYETNFGNTKKVAEVIAEGIRETEQIKTEVMHVSDTDYSKVEDFDAIIIGSPNWGGTYAGSIKKFINGLAEFSLSEKYYAVFDTNNDLPILNKASKKLEKKIGKKIPSFKRILPGLPVKVIGLKGPIAEGELPKCKTFGKKIALNLQK
ncbi:MAG: flavodoxin family protein [Candidatus Heimdallarchaeota archaeon]